jgi:hypothetical protein
MTPWDLGDSLLRRHVVLSVHTSVQQAITTIFPPNHLREGGGRSEIPRLQLSTFCHVAIRFIGLQVMLQLKFIQLQVILQVRYYFSSRSEGATENFLVASEIFF